MESSQTAPQESPQAAGKVRTMKRKKQKVRQVFKTTLTNECSAFQCVILPRTHVNETKFQKEDLVRVTVELVKRAAGRGE